MNKRATQDLLEELHSATAKALLARVRSGEATAADLSAASKFLKDNGIEGVGAPGTPLNDLAAALPFAGGDDHPTH